MKFGKIRIGMLLTLFILFTITANAQQVYQYTGDPFTSALPPYTISDRISGEFSVALPLAPSLSTVDLTGLITDFNFTDGQQTRTPANSTICQFEISTDGAGNIIDWLIFLREAPTPAVSFPQHTIDIFMTGDLAGTAGAGAFDCDNLSNPDPVASNNTPGSWSGASSQPTDYNYTGQPFDTVTPPYTTSDRITGGFSVTGPLPLYLPAMDLTSFLLDFSFTDGQQIRTPANSTICFFNAATDGTGNIIDWQIVLREAPTPAVGNPQQSLATTSDVDQGLSVAAGATACADTVGAFSQGQVLMASGSWSGVAIQPAQLTHYAYNGDPFTFADPPYALGDRITGSITVATPLPPSLPPTDFSNLLLSFSFTDGQQTRSPTDSVVCSATLSTDASGNIIQWAVTFQESPLPVNGASHSLGTTTANDSAGFGMASIPCESIVASPGASNLTGGTWMIRNLPSIPIPSLSPAGLLVLAMLLLLLSAWRLSHYNNGSERRNKRL